MDTKLRYGIKGTMPRTSFSILVMLISGSCVGATRTESSKEMSKAQAKADSEYVASCQHRASARYRLYGCASWAYGPTPLIVLNGQVLPTDTVGPGRLKREELMAKAKSDGIENISVLKRSDSLAIKRFGPEGANGVLLITTKSAKGIDSLQIQ